MLFLDSEVKQYSYCVSVVTFYGYSFLLEAHRVPLDLWTSSFYCSTAQSSWTKFTNLINWCLWGRDAVGGLYCPFSSFQSPTVHRKMRFYPHEGLCHKCKPRTVSFLHSCERWPFWLLSSMNDNDRWCKSMYVMSLSNPPEGHLQVPVLSPKVFQAPSREDKALLI